LKSLVSIALVASLCLACGGPDTPPKRGVLERDVEAWGFRRYQSVLDPEVWVKENRSRGFTASYARKQAEKRGRLGERDVVNAFVTRFKSHDGLIAALVRFARRLAQESGYSVEEDSLYGTRVIMISGHGERWAWWVSKKHILKLGGRGVEKVPKDLVEAYADYYPSALKQGVLDSELEPVSEPKLETEEYDPDNPKTSWQRQDEDAPADKKKRKRKRKKRRKK